MKRHLVTKVTIVEDTTCHFCREPIPAGEDAIRFMPPYPGEMFEFVHPKCFAEMGMQVGLGNTPNSVEDATLTPEQRTAIKELSIIKKQRDELNKQYAELKNKIENPCAMNIKTAVDSLRMHDQNDKEVFVPGSMIVPQKYYDRAKRLLEKGFNSLVIDNLHKNKKK